MIGSFVTRGLVMVFGYAYPAYECFKTVEKNKPDAEQLRFWCQYWILVAVLTVCERVGDAFVSWIPMYSEGKLAFFIYLWYPKMKGTAYVYDSFFRPYIARHETEIDQNLSELRNRAGNIAILYWQKAASYGQTRVLEIFQYVASQSAPTPHPIQRQRSRPEVCQNSNVINHKLVATSDTRCKELTYPASEAQSDDLLEKVACVAGPSQVPQMNPLRPDPSLSKTTALQLPVAASNMQIPETEGSSQSAAAEEDGTEINGVSPAIENGDPPWRGSVMGEAIRATRATLRRTRAAVGR